MTSSKPLRDYIHLVGAAFGGGNRSLVRLDEYTEFSFVSRGQSAVLARIIAHGWQVYALSHCYPFNWRIRT